MNIRAFCPVHENAEPMAPAHQRKRRFGWSQHGNFTRRGRTAAKRARMIFSVGPVISGDDERRKPPERRQIAALALLDFAGVKGVRIAADDSPHHGMVRLISLNETEALAPRSPRAARDLIEQLERAFGRARIAIGKPQIGIHHAHQCHVGKIVSFGDKLRADDDIRFAFCDSVKFQPQPLHATRHIRRKNDDSRVIEGCRHFLRDALHAGAAGNQMIQRAAFRAGLRHRLMIAALVAHQLAAKTMFHQPA